ncbi:MAG: hypothetical protein A4E65_00641 [Syntrophorhabdus sp. PtaU1.Bin153]|nr:MAG: hypothetical protein A4E65_00641 [Syntrophorhabdus sp. PtaU1.Bin153]
MIKEIRFTVTGVVRKPLAGEWFLGNKGMPIQAIHDFHTTQFPILKVEVKETQTTAGEKVA